VYHPSAAFRRILKQAAGQTDAVSAGRLSWSAAMAEVGYAPRLLSLGGAALAVGVVSGILELSVQAVQLRVLHFVDSRSLMISQHAGWMVVVADSLLTAGLTLLLMAPAVAWADWRKRTGAGVHRFYWTWDLAGAILGTLLLLGPLQKIHGLHPAAPVALALGAGIRLRRWLVWRSRGWQRLARWSGATVIGVLPIYAVAQRNSVATAPERAWSRPAAVAPNLLWIVVDTLRADHMSVYGYDRPTTPNLEAWAKEGITFEMARSAAPWTLPSHMTMFTGLLPSQHGARVDRPYYGASPTVAEHLQAKGYATAGIVANVRICNRAYGIGRGFDQYVDYPWNQAVSLKAAMINSALGVTVMNLARGLRLPVPRHYPAEFRRPARAITDDGRRWLDQVGERNASGDADARRPFFLFLNLMDVHGPYLPAPGSTRRFWTGLEPTKEQAVPECGWVAVRELENALPEERPRRQQELEAVSRRLVDLYDDCLHGVDAELGRFLGKLRDAGMLANTWVVITADHGEHFGERNLFSHGSSLYNELTHVPLLLIPPLGSGEPRQDPTPALRGRRVRVPVSTRDLAVTMAQLAGSRAENPFPGQSLVRYWSDAPLEAPHPVLAQLEEPRLCGDDFHTENVTRIDSLIDEDHLLIDGHNQPLELYHLFSDPRHERNLAGEPVERALMERLKRRLDALQVELGRPTIPRAICSPDDRTECDDGENRS
jgi:arylsulfatase A-like enzyme